MRLITRSTILFGGLILLGASVCVFAQGTNKANSSRCAAPPSEITIDRAWGGARVAFDALENKDYLYVAYYDADRWLTVAQVNKCNGGLEKIRVPSRFGGWDEHNSIALAFDAENRLNVSGNMHVSPLVYARMDVPDRLAGLSILRGMVGADEERTTYPYFFRFPDGALAFSYRSGQSGDGIELINRLVGSDWVRWTNQPVFAPNRDGTTINAYHSDYVLGPDKFFHVAWVWRRTYKVETNFHVNYAKSRDLRVWEDSRGNVLSSPITPASAEVVDQVPENSGLFNNVRLGFDEEGRPTISYLKFDATGATQLFHARPGSNGWISVPATDWGYRWDPRGGGSVPSEISFSGVKVSDGRLIEQVKQPEIGSKIFVYGDDSLKVQEALNPDVDEPTAQIKDRHPPKGAILNARAVRAESSRAGVLKYRYAISWFSLPVDNRDKPRDCARVGLPCDFISELVLHSSPIANPRKN
ncbi:BNR repeat-containing protein [Paraburkholderia fynbosensis]|uniref:Uncharacterized protein n=1 Tax=Paraburkholderia fynbosensis TaxID=1200993 RepID=A0A6J5GVL2_9BURK|nr:BNR repeat-containing protein [Paraburkholderia fynbosensis]CAB3806009.1 hypothetical protein LMG27177_06018 [Paraburkholderia fynbosensis]